MKHGFKRYLNEQPKKPQIRLPFFLLLFRNMQLPKEFPEFAGGAVLLALWSGRRAPGKGPIKTFPQAGMTPASLPAGLSTLVIACQWPRSALCLQASLPSQNRQMVTWGQVVQMNFTVNDKHSQCKIRNTSFLKGKVIQEIVIFS